MRTRFWFLALALLGCGTDDANSEGVTVAFAAEVGGEPFACDQVYSGLGTTGSEYQPDDLRFFVHDLRGTTADGNDVPITLSEDSAWQARGVALIDLRSGGSCSETAANAVVTGTVPAGTGPLTGIRFRIGVPESENHLDPATAPSPLNIVSMFWGWEAGFQHLHIEGRLAGTAEGRLFHLGSTNCSGSVQDGTRTCANSNRPEIVLDTFDPETQTIIADLADLYSTSDLSVDEGGSSGCRSAADDPECTTLFSAVGLDGSTQRLFRVETR